MKITVQEKPKTEIQVGDYFNTDFGVRRLVMVKTDGGYKYGALDIESYRVLNIFDEASRVIQKYSQDDRFANIKLVSMTPEAAEFKIV
ncbi:hypothetical protein [Peribacillus muralis]|uniref:hypothetical protein n=1 Tax=Peribacillus muralis TaxID=264697 RepID=UPI003672D8DB